MLSHLPADDRIAGRTVVRAEELPRTRLFEQEIRKQHTIICKFTNRNRESILFVQY